MAQGYLLLCLNLVVNKHLTPAPGHLFGFSIWLVAMETVDSCRLSSACWKAQRWGWRDPAVPPLFQIQGCLQGCLALGLSSTDMVERLAVLGLCCWAQILLQCFVSWMKSFLGASHLWKPLSKGPRHCVSRRGGTNHDQDWAGHVPSVLTQKWLRGGDTSLGGGQWEG